MEVNVKQIKYDYGTFKVLIPEDTTKEYTEIPKRLKCINQNAPYVCGTEDVIDDESQLTLAQINELLENGLETINEEIHGTGGINDRLDDIEAAESITYDGGEALIALGSDFTNPDATKRSKVPTVGAILDGLNDGIYDVSKRFPTGGPNSDGKFTLEYILNNADTLIPTSWRHGGMSVSFVQIPDHKYIQARLMANAFTTDITKWQVVDDEPTVGSDNLVKSSGIDRSIKIFDCVNIDSQLIQGQWIKYDSREVHTELGWASNYFSAEDYEYIVLKGTGGGSPLLYSYCDILKHPISASSQYQTEECVVLRFSDSIKYILVNVKTDEPYSVYGKKKEKDTKIQYALDSITDVRLNNMYIDGGWILTKGDIGWTMALTYTEDSKWRYCIVECKEGDVFSLTGKGGDSPRAFAFVSSSYVLLSVADNTSGFFNNEIIIAPTGAKYLIVNSQTSFEYNLILNPSAIIHHLAKNVESNDKVYMLNDFKKGIYDSITGNYYHINHGMCYKKTSFSKGRYIFDIPSFLGDRILLAYWQNGTYKGRITPLSGSTYSHVIADIPGCVLGIMVISQDNVTPIIPNELGGYYLNAELFNYNNAEEKISSVRNSGLISSSNLDSTQLLKNYMNGIKLSQEFSNPIAVIDGMGGSEHLHHAPAFCIVDDVVYFIEVGAEIFIESPSDLSMRVVAGYFSLSSPSDITYITAFQNGQTYAGKSVTRLDACAMVYLEGEGGCHIYTNVGNSSEDFVIHRFFDFTTKELSTVTIPTFTYDTTTIPFVYQNIRNLVGETIGIEPQMQMLCPNSYDGKIYGSYSGYGGKTIILSTEDGLDFKFVSIPTFEHTSYCETTVANISNNVLAVMIRQNYTDMYQRFSFYHIDTGIWDSPVDIIDVQSRSCAFKFGDNWYFLHNSGYTSDSFMSRKKHQLLMVNGNLTSNKECLQVVKDSISDVRKFYYYVFPYGDDCYIMFSNSRWNIYFCKLTVDDTYTDDIIRSKMLELFNEELVYSYCPKSVQRG